VENTPSGGDARVSKSRENLIAYVTGLLRDGNRLPSHLMSELFEAPREYELRYRGKARRADILSDTLSVPLQPVKRFGATSGWANMLIFGDNLQVLKTLLEWKEAGTLKNADGTPGVRLCYIDPPFATEREFRAGKGQIAYADKVAGAEFQPRPYILGTCASRALTR
jgi:hypothetical protein